ncbi:hypothetical protein PAPYR_12987 [Paratrimastix pyriformis]|uniref:Uncharacterized protein n=1 Tax=Paratrimastix pyriformis TaxID=342808 RepID=A0ABQ8U4P5_9EUKA|nr:hypothetical protein PAPYR_12987 [Paratrimastix pyriformis]
MVFTHLRSSLTRVYQHDRRGTPYHTFERSVFGLNNEIFVGLIITLRHRTAHCTAKFILFLVSHLPELSGRALAPWAQDAIPHVRFFAPSARQLLVRTGALVPSPPTRSAACLTRHPQASPAPIVVIPPAGNDIKITMPQTPTTTIDVCEDPPAGGPASRSGLPGGATRGETSTGATSAAPCPLGLLCAARGPPGRRTG